MTVKQFQSIAGITAIDDISHMALIVCILHGYTEDYVDNMQPKKALKLFSKVSKTVKRIEKRYWLRTRKMQTNAFKLNFGQFIEINHWLKDGEIESYHNIAASAIDSNNHKSLAEKILHENIRQIILPVRKLLTSYAALLTAYKNLFEIKDKEQDEEVKDEKPHLFIEQYGWLYSAKTVSEHLGINVDAVYKISVLEAFNTMAYLKSFNEYQQWQSQKVS